MIFINKTVGNWFLPIWAWANWVSLLKANISCQENMWVILELQQIFFELGHWVVAEQLQVYLDGTSILGPFLLNFRCVLNWDSMGQSSVGPSSCTDRQIRDSNSLYLFLICLLLLTLDHIKVSGLSAMVLIWNVEPLMTLYSQPMIFRIYVKPLNDIIQNFRAEHH